LRLAAGSTLWLAAHELRLDWRRRSAARGARRWMAVVLTLGAPVFLGLTLGIPLALAMKLFGPPQGPTASLIAAAALASAFLLMLSQALAEVVDALYERGDLDLLFSSPLSPARVILVRGLGVAFATFSVFGFFSMGPLVAIAVMGQPLWLAVLPVLYACALAATGGALAIGAVLIGLVGPRRTRFIGRALSVVIGSMFFLAMQVFTLTSGLRSTEIAAGWAQRLTQGAPWSTGLVLRALKGEAGPFVLLVGAFVLAFLLAAFCVGPQFARFHAAAQGAAPRRAGSSRARRRFRGGAFAAVLGKELRLLLRDPLLLPQILLRVIYLAPAALLAVRYGAQMNLTGLSGAAMALTLMANQLAGSLVWITISAEDAPDLLASSPAPRRLVLVVKLVAALGVVMAFVSLAAVPLTLIAPFQGLVVFVGCATAAVSAGLVNLWWQRPGKRTSFRKRAPAPWFVTVAELAIGLLVALATALLAAHQLAGLAPALVAALVLAGLGLAARQHGADDEAPQSQGTRAGMRAT
jgi:ABC-2 type transport system permease protein